MIVETRITVNNWLGRWHILCVAFTCFWAAISPGDSIVIISRDV
jgi:hypothetical protein